MNHIAAAGAVIVLALGASHPSLAAAKKPSANAQSFKECCEKSFAIYYVDDKGKGNCRIRGPQKDAYNQCIYQRGVKVIHNF